MTSLVNPHFLLIVSSFYVFYVYVSYVSSAVKIHLYLKHINYINRIMNHKRKQLYPTLVYCPSICMEEVQNAERNCRATLNPGRVSNFKHMKYHARVLITTS